MPATDEQRARVRKHLSRRPVWNALDEATRAVLADSEALAAQLDLIAWSLRLPLLWEQATRVDDHATPGEQAAEHARLDALIAEGERALGIQPPEGES